MSARRSNRSTSNHTDRRVTRAAACALGLAFATLLSACNKAGDAGGGTARERSMASPASSPSNGMPEPTPGASAARP